jgi:hypothetical protein
VGKGFEKRANLEGEENGKTIKREAAARLTATKTSVSYMTAQRRMEKAASWVWLESTLQRRDGHSADLLCPSSEIDEIGILMADYRMLAMTLAITARMPTADLVVMTASEVEAGAGIGTPA